MNLNPVLDRNDRVASFVTGAALVAFGAMGEFDLVWARVLVVGCGLMLVAGGIGGL